MDSIIEKVTDNIWKVKANSNIYFLNFNKKILIDVGDRAYRQRVKTYLSKVVDFDKIDIVIFTHLHFDHIGNFDLFKNAKFYASEQSIKDFNKDPVATVLLQDIAEKFKSVKLNKLPENFNGLKIIETAGHTKGSICLWYEKEKILFSGDTLFFNKNIGRLDLPTSIPEKMQESLITLVNYNYKVLCPGHDY
jgi:hydroxyacylglutathione hydrolase